MLGERIARLRLDKEMTQEELAKALQMTRSALSLYELDKREPDAVTLSKIAESVSDDPELLEFWDDLKEREDLRIFFKQTRELSPADIKKVMRIIKAIEDEEAADDSL